jgi:hypothetical protein
LRQWGWLAALLWPVLALGQDRPNEDALFGAPDAPETDAGAPVDRPAEGALFGEADAGMAAPSRDVEQLSGGEVKNQFDTGKEQSDPLRIGGMLYVRGLVNWGLDQPFEKTAFAVPSILDTYLDARPSEQVRGFVLGRLRYDPTYSAPTGSGSLLVPAGSSSAANPAVFLDQMWLRFNILHKVYLTIGRQKVKWGVGRLWNPTDFLNPQRRDPLAPLDLRLGINAVKVHVPVESLGWNFYAYGLLDNNGPTNTLGQLGGALRAEVVLGPAEVGLAGVWVKGRRPRYALDVSTPLGPFDVYGEFAFRDGRDFTQFRQRTDQDPAPMRAEDLFPSYRLNGLQLQTTAGLSYSLNYTDANTFTVGLEYFYNPAGANSPVLYIPQIYAGTFTPFYAGQHYVGVFALAPGLPNYPWISLSFNNLLNLSDPSGVARFDAFFRVMTVLTIETFVSVNYGVRGGEFRFGGTFPQVDLESGPVGPFSIPYPVASAGVGLRLSI